MVRLVKVTFLIFMIFISHTFAEEITDAELKNVFEKAKVDLSVIDMASTITRFDCVALIMTAIGVPHNCGEEAYGYTPLLSQEDELLLMNDIGNMDLFKYNTTAYVYFLIEHNTGVIFGEKLAENRKIHFNVSRCVTVKEIVAFMVRCLEQTGDAGLDETYCIAQKYGLLKEGDMFLENPDEEILYKDFLTILKRFLNMKQYLHFEITSGGYSELWTEGRFRKNKNRDITYYEYLKKVVDTKQYDREMK